MKTMIILFVLAWQGAAGLLFAQKLTLEVRGFEAIKDGLMLPFLSFAGNVYERTAGHFQSRCGGADSLHSLQRASGRCLCRRPFSG